MLTQIASRLAASIACIHVSKQRAIRKKSAVDQQKLPSSSSSAGNQNPITEHEASLDRT